MLNYNSRVFEFFVAKRTKYKKKKDLNHTSINHRKKKEISFSSLAIHLLKNSSCIFV